MAKGSEMTRAATAPRRRVPAAERRDALIEAAVHQFAHGGLHGTSVGQIARDVGVAQPYVFSLFPTKLDLFLAAVERGFDSIAELFERTAKRYREEGPVEPDEEVLGAMGGAYVESLATEHDLLLLQLQSYAACGEEEIRIAVRDHYARLIGLARELSGADDERLDEFFRGGMWLNVAAALGVEDLSKGEGWVQSIAPCGAKPNR
jgi:AcrR family transcriptional regulator